MVLLAFDDTDSVAGGCTTHLAFELARNLPGVDLIGPPRLVRLNPTVPHKTRGNGAVALRLGNGRGRPSVVGWDGDRSLVAYADAEPLSGPQSERVLEHARRLISSRARLDSPKTHPGLAVFPQAPDEAAYHAAVSRYVGRSEFADLWRAPGVRTCSWKEGRGLIGATAAAAWPARRVTYEWIAYRDEPLWGTERNVDPALGREIDQGHPSTFDNYDANHDHLRITPSSPCPILAGIRGTDPEDLARAVARLGPEQAAGSLLFETNQATDDQFIPVVAAQTRPFTSPQMSLRITAAARSWRGGHVFIRAADDSGDVDLVAFEPTKEFREAVRRLRVGDAVRVHGSIQGDPRLVALERLEVLSSAPRRLRRAPDCTACRRRMKSRGRAEAYECPRCRRTAPAILEEEQRVAEVHAEVPVCVRRHLTRPLALKALARESAPARAAARSA